MMEGSVVSVQAKGSPAAVSRGTLGGEGRSRDGTPLSEPPPPSRTLRPSGYTVYTLMDLLQRVNPKHITLTLPTCCLS
jgi:hypothetical protein